MKINPVAVGVICLSFAAACRGDELADKGRALDAEKTALQRDIERREAELLMLERDPGFIEVKARDTLDMCQAGEVVFRFDGDAGE